MVILHKQLIGIEKVIRDLQIMQSVSRILQRSERQENLDKLIETFVDLGILPQIYNKNHQIIYGRRGTGKTHLLKVLGSRLQEDKKNAVVYIDARTLGSTTQFSDPDIPLPQRCLALFRDILGEIHNALLEHIIEHPSKKADSALQAADQLASAITDPFKTYRETRVATASGTSLQDKGGSLSFEVSANPKVGLNTNLGKEYQTQHEVRTEYAVEIQDKVIFPPLHKNLSESLELADAYLFILIDEWSSLPTEIQPYLAEFLKRGVLPVQRAILKVASLSYRSRFEITLANHEIGFELGADIASALDLDDYYVFDRNPDQITSAYADMLLKHLNTELPDSYLEKAYRVKNGADLASRMFTERETFKELARASEGVVRDLINIFTKAFFHSHRNSRDSIDRKGILEGARQWFEQDKAAHLDEQLHTVLRRIVDEVIGKKRARSFLLPRHLEKHPIIQRLFDSRVLHHMQRGYADKDNPGIRYNIYTLDYGTYVDLMGTSKEPNIDLIPSETDKDIVVPFDDKRSIRRIVLDESVLS